jgi:hypothetical protein
MSDKPIHVITETRKEYDERQSSIGAVIGRVGFLGTSAIVLIGIGWYMAGTSSNDVQGFIIIAIGILLLIFDYKNSR